MKLSILRLKRSFWSINLAKLLVLNGCQDRKLQILLISPSTFAQFMKCISDFAHKSYGSTLTEKSSKFVRNKKLETWVDLTLFASIRLEILINQFLTKTRKVEKIRSDNITHLLDLLLIKTAKNPEITDGRIHLSGLIIWLKMPDILCYLSAGENNTKRLLH